MAALAADREPAGELKIGQVGIANLRLLRWDPAGLAEEMRERVRRAPKLFARAAVVIDPSALSRPPEPAELSELIQKLREAGVLPVALAYGTREVEHLAEALGLPLLSKFRAQYEPSADASTARPIETPAGAGRSSAEGTASIEPPAGDGRSPATGPASSLIHDRPVRSGQQVYAQGRDLVVTAAVGAGAEVIADGSLHIYAPLRGRALAGAQGDRNTRIFCAEFDAELVAIAGHYKLMEEIPSQLRGKPVQIRLDQDTLRIEDLT